MWVSAQHTWIDYTGTEWDLSYGLSGLKLMRGTRGMRPSPHQRFSGKSPGRPGSIYRGQNSLERDVMWPLKVFSYEGSAAWIRHNTRFWDGMDADRPGYWVVTQPGYDDQPSTRRSLKIRYEGLVDDSDDDDLGLVPWVNYGINLVADEDPMWRGEPIRRTFTAAGGEDFYGGAGGGGFGPPYFISAGSTTDGASISNPGDVTAAPVWKVSGPTTNATAAVDGHLISFPMTLAAGQWIRLDTDEAEQIAIDQDGNDRTLELGAVDFAHIPRGSNVPLAISITGTGSVEVEIVPGYQWAKGLI